MSKTVGILTFHHADNYGAVLQAYALANAIDRLGHSVEIIDYRPIAARKQYNKFGVRSGKFVQVLTRRWRFHRFRKRFLPLSHRVYLSPESLKANPPQVECLICGSDQIWNVASYRGFDPAFFLEFARESCVRKTSYAASFGGASDFGVHRPRIAELLREFDCISVRDTQSQSTVKSLIDHVPMRVLDPTFLSDFATITPPCRYSNPYILIYCLERPPLFGRIVRELCQRLNLPAISIGTALEGAKVLEMSSPQEWLSLVKHAAFILTNSFHGLCFSIINRKNFLVIPHSKGQVRLDDLLAWLQLTNRVVSEEAGLNATCLEDVFVNYAPIEPVLDVAIKDSWGFLNEILES